MSSIRMFVLLTKIRLFSVYRSINFFYFSTKTYVVGSQKKFSNEFFWTPKTNVKTDGQESIHYFRSF